MKKYFILTVLFCYSMHGNAQVLPTSAITQEQSYWFWAACDKCILNYYGLSTVQQCTIADYARTMNTSFGTVPCCTVGCDICNQWDPFSGSGGQIDILQHFRNISSTEIFALPYSEIATQINEGKPLLVWWNACTGSGVHETVIHGVSDGELVFSMDPWPGEGESIVTYSSLMSGTGFCFHSALEITCPKAIAGTKTLCPGTTTTLSDSTSGGTWSSSSTGIATISSAGIVTGISAGTAMITYTVPCGFATTKVTVNSLPAAITGTPNVCSVLSDTLSDATSGGTWSSSNPSVATVGYTSGKVAGVTIGTAIITYTIPTGCRSTITTTVNMTYLIHGIDSVCARSTTNLSDTITGGIWSSSNLSVATVSSTGVVTGVAEGTTIITYSLSAGCYVDTMVLVKKTPDSIIGPLGICPGGTADYFDSTTGGFWSSSNSSLVIIDSASGVALAVGTGLYPCNIIYDFHGCAVSHSIGVDGPSVHGTIGLCIDSLHPSYAGYFSLQFGWYGGLWWSADTFIAQVDSLGANLAWVNGMSAGSSWASTTIYHLGCGRLDSVWVWVAPSAGRIRGPHYLCPGAIVTYSCTASPIGSGSWGVANVVGCPPVSLDPITGAMIAGSCPGGFDIYYWEPNYDVGGPPYNCGVGYYHVLIGDSMRISGENTVCTGSTITLSSNIPGGVWTSSNDTIATVDSNGIVTGIIPGNDTIYYANPLGCGTLIDTFAITVQQTPTRITGIYSVCVGATTALYSSPSGTWSSDNTDVCTVDSSGVVTGVSPGMATISNSVGSCSVTAIVTVNPLPSAAISGPSIVCVDGNITLTDPSTGCIWSSSAPSIAYIGSSSGIVSGVSSGSATILYTNNFGCSVSKHITVNPLPAVNPISGTNTICVGSGTALSDITSGGTWSSLNTSVATIGTSGLVSAVCTTCCHTAIIYRVTINGCTSEADEEVYIIPSPQPISGPSSICVGSATIYSDAITCGNNFSDGGYYGEWFVNGSFSNFGPTADLTFSSPGSVTISYATGCGSPATKTVAVNPLPDVGPINGTLTVCTGSTTNLTDVTGGGVWFSSDTLVATVTNSGVVTGVAAGTANISYMVSNSCGLSFAVAIVTVYPVPSAISGHDTICVGPGSSLTTMSCSPSGGIWSSSDTTIATIDGTGMVTGVAAGTATITYSFESCFVTKRVTVYPFPSLIWGPLPYYLNCSPVTFYDSVSGGIWACDYGGRIDSVTGFFTSYPMDSGFAFNPTITYSIYSNSVQMCYTAFVWDGGSMWPTPIVSPITGDSVVCVGASIILNDSYAGWMYWSTTWSGSNSSIATVGDMGTYAEVDGISPGVDTITVTNYNMCGSVSASKIVTVNVTDAGIITGTLTVCAGSTTHLTDVTAGGIWSSGSPEIATVDSTGTVTGVAAGTAIISYAVNTCGTSYTTAIITVNPLPAITLSPDVTICNGSSTPLTATGGTTYTWSPATGLSATTGASVTATPALTITYTVTGTTNGCSNTASVTVTVNPAVSITLGTNPTVAYGATTANLPFTATTGSPTNYSIVYSAAAHSAGFTDVSSATLPGSPIILTVPGTAPVAVYNGTVTVTNGCVSPGVPFTVTITSTNTPPTFTGGSPQTLSVCQNASATFINTLMTVSDIDPGQTETWTIVTAPAHGTLAGFSTTASSGSTSITPTGLTYQPTAGYSGADAFVVRVSDGLATTTTTVNVIVNPLPNAGTISGLSTVCVRATITLSDTPAGGTWSSSNTSVAMIGSSGGIVSGVSTGTAIISYRVTNSCGTVYATKTVTVNTIIPTNGIISTFAGTGTGGFNGDGGAATATQIYYPSAMIADANGNLLFADRNNNRIRKISPAGIVTTIAGNGTLGFSGDGGPATAAKLNNPTGIAIDASGNLFIADQSNQRIRKVDTSGIITTVAGNGTYPIPGTYAGSGGDGGPATSAQLNYPAGVGVDVSGNLYIADRNNNRIRKVNTSGIITNVVGLGGGAYIYGTGGYGGDGGPASAAQLSFPTSVVFDGSGNLYIADGFNNRIRKVDAATNIITTVAGDSSQGYTGDNGPATAAELYNPTDIAIDRTGNLFIADQYNHAIRKVNTAGIIVTVAGNGTLGYSGDGGLATLASMNYPENVAIDTSGNIFIADFYNNRIRKVSFSLSISGTYTVCTGSTTPLSDNEPGGVWSSGTPGIGTVSSTGIVTGIANGTTTISYTVSNACGIAIATAVVTVNATNAGVISGLASVIVDSSITLTDAVSGGIWSASNTKAIVSGGVVTGLVAGIDTISYSVTGICGVAIARKVIAINNPGINGGANICTGKTSTLSNTVPGGTWSSSNGVVASVGVSTGIVTGNTAGTATITYTQAGTYTTIVVTVNASPLPVQGSTSECVGITVMLSDVTAGGSWSCSNTNVTISGSGNLTGINVGTSTITYTLTDGCYATYPNTVLPNPSPITGIGRVCIGGTTMLTDTTSGAISWTSSNTLSATVINSGQVTGVASGTAIITYKVLSGCTAMTIVTVTALPSPVTGGSSAICPGALTALTDVAGSGIWSSSNIAVASVGTGSGMVTGVSGGTAKISYSPSGTSGCTIFKTVTVNTAPAISGSATVCVNGTITLSDATTGGTWISSNSSATIGSSTGTVSGVSAGTVTITYTTPAGCRVMKIITINPLPSAILGSSALCLGGSSILSDMTAGGIWSSAATARATIGSATGIAIGVSTGTTTITYTVSGCYVTTMVTVNSVPSAISGTTIVCSGSTTTLSATPTWGTWSSGSPGIASIGSPGIVTGVAPGKALISYILSSPVCGVSIVVTVNASPGVITGNTPVCTGATTSLSDIPGGGTWSSSSTTIATVGSSSGIMTGISHGTTIITYKTGNGCYVTVTGTVNAATSAISGASSLCQGTTITLSDATTGGAWSSSNPGVASVVSTGVVSGVGTGTANISYTAVTGCISVKTITVNPVPSAIGGTLALCANAITTLTDASGGGSWSISSALIASIGNTSGIVTASGTYTGTATISYTLGGCAVTGVLTVNPNPNPVQGVTSECAGSTVTLSDITSGGTWSITGDAGIGVTGILTAGASAGSATITYMLTTGCYVTYPNAVLANPAPITGTTRMCAGGTTILSDTTSGALSYTSSNTLTATVDNSGTVTCISAGTTTITYAITSGCMTTIVVTVSPATPAITGGGSAICPGIPTALTDASGAGTWGSSNTAVATVGSASGIVTGAGNGTATITYSPSGTSGCIATTVITVSPVAAITGPTSVCAGSTITLNDATAGGAWSSSNGNATVVSGTGVVTGVSAGAVTISYTTGSGCIATSAIVVNAIPAAISGTTGLCLGGTVTLTDATGGGTWSSSNTSVATVGSGTGVVTGTGTATATITYTAGGCYNTITVTVGATPSAILGTKSVCAGSTTSLSDGTSGGTWSATGDATVGSTGVVTGGGSAGTATISYTLLGGCGVAAVVTINAGPTAITGNTPTCIGSTLALTDAVSGGTWTSSNTSTATIGSGTGIVTGVAAGVVVITYSTGGSCFATANVTVNGAIGAITGPSSVCVGLMIALTDATTGGTWSSSNPAIGSVSTTGIVTGLGVGSTNIIYTIGSCNRVVPISVNPAPAAISGTLSICGGTTTTLTDATGGGAWSLASSLIATIGSATGLVTASGTYTGTTTVSYTLGGCPAIAVLTVVAKPNPIQGATSECVGVTITLSDAAAGGAWSCSNADVSFGSTGGSPVTVTGVTAGASTITYSLGLGCYVTIANSVYANPGPITGTFVVCTGFTTTLSDATAGGAWTSSAPSVASASGYTITGVTAGTAIITYKIPTGSCIATQMVTVNTTPVVTAISGPTSISHATPATLSDATAGGIWTSNHTTVISLSGSTGSPVTATAVATSGTATISYAVTNTGCTTTVTKIISAAPAPPHGSGTGSGTTLFVGATVNLIDDVASGLWTSSDNGIATVDGSGSVTGIRPGSVNITHTITSEQGDVTTNVTPVVVTAPAASVSVVPNPNKGTFTVKGTLGSMEDEEATLEATDVLGQVIYHSKVTAYGGRLNETITLNNTLSNGMYMLSVQSGTEHKVFHFVIEQ